MFSRTLGMVTALILPLVCGCGGGGASSSDVKKLQEQAGPNYQMQMVEEDSASPADTKSTSPDQ